MSVLTFNKFPLFVLNMGNYYFIATIHRKLAVVCRVMNSSLKVVTLILIFTGRVLTNTLFQTTHGQVEDQLYISIGAFS